MSRIYQCHTYPIIGGINNDNLVMSYLANDTAWPARVAVLITMIKGITTYITFFLNKLHFLLTH